MTEKTALVDIYLSLGSNLGNPVDQLRRAFFELVRRKLIVEPIRGSSFYRTPPWGNVPDQPWFVNAVVGGKTLLPPEELLGECKAIESDLGRHPSSVRWGPREIDIDLLLYGRALLNLPDLIVPHPRLTERAFVLVPLLEIAPELTDPATGRPYALDLKQLASDVQAIENLPESLDEREEP